MRNHRTGVWAISALLLLGLHIWSVDAWAKKAVVGSLAVASGEVRVNKVAGIPGTTVFEGNVIATGSKSSATIDLRSGTRVTVGERSEVSVPYGMAPAGLGVPQRHCGRPNGFRTSQPNQHKVADFCRLRERRWLSRFMQDCIDRLRCECLK